MGTEAEVLAERPGLCVLAGDGAVVKKEGQTEIYTEKEAIYLNNMGEIKVIGDEKMSEQIEIKGEINLRIFEVVRRLKQEVDDLYEELEILMDKKTVESVERSRKEMQDGELYDWGEFKKIVDEE